LIGDSSCCDYETVGKLNIDFSAKLAEVVNMPFFRYFKVKGGLGNFDPIDQDDVIRRETRRSDLRHPSNFTDQERRS